MLFPVDALVTLHSLLSIVQILSSISASKLTPLVAYCVSLFIPSFPDALVTHSMCTNNLRAIFVFD